MSLSLEKLCQNIDFDYFQGSNSIDSDIRYVVSYSTDLMPQNKTVVVVGTYADLVHAPKNLFSNFLCVTSLEDISKATTHDTSLYPAPYPSTYYKGVSPHSFSMGELCIGYAKQSSSVVQTLISVRKELDWQLDFYKYSHRLYDALNKNMSLQHIVDVATDIFINPIVVANNSFHVLASSKITLEDDPLWKYITDHASYPKEYIERVASLKHYSTIYGCEASGLIDDGEETNRYFSRKISVDKKAVGFISIIEIIQEIDIHYSDLLDVLCNVLSIAFKDSLAYKARYNQRYMYVINELLTTRMNTTQLKNRLEYAALKPLTYLNVLLFYPQRVNKIMSADYLMNSLAPLIAGGKGTIQPDDSIAFIAMRNDILQPIITDMEALIHILEKYNLNLGISFSYRNIQDTMIFANQAREALMLGQRLTKSTLNKIFNYEDYCFFHLIKKSVPNEQMIHYCNPKILEIQNYDIENNTDYLNTLRHFLKHDMNVGETAKAMYVHRNTIDYRIGRIKDLFGLSFNEPNISFVYLMSLYILDYIKDTI